MTCLSIPSVVLAPCTVEVVRDLAGLDALQADWEALYATSPTAAPPLRWEWVRTWWQIYGPVYGYGGQGLRVVVIRRAGRLVGVLPLYLGTSGNFPLAPRCLRFVSCGADEFEETCAEYLNLLHAPGEETACLKALAPLVCDPNKLGWDELQLSALPAASPLLRLEEGFNGRCVRLERGTQHLCHQLSLANGFEAFLQRVSHKNRREARKLLRAVETVDAQFEVAADVSQLHLFFDQMIALHRQRWTSVGKLGCFFPRHAQFHRQTSKLLLGRGEAVIARLAHADQPLAVVFAYRVRDQLHGYQQGVVAQEFGRLRSPGTAAWLLLMRQQAEQGMTVLDHLRGLSTFKERFATDQTPVEQLRVWQRGVRTVTASAVTWTQRVVRRMGRLAGLGKRSGFHGSSQGKAQ